MLTIKHVEKGGYECVRAVETVDYTPTDGVLAYGCAGSETPMHFVTGKVYVMNHSGATVAAYEMTAEN